MKSKNLSLNLPALGPNELYQRAHYSCGCELTGKAPLPVFCPTHKGQTVPPEAHKQVLVSLLLDESGSMQTVVDSTIEAVNGYTDGLAAPGIEYLVTLTKFDSGIPVCRTLYQNSKVGSIMRLSREVYTPRGGTPLYDAIGEMISSLAYNAAGRPVICIIVTDGAENSSKTYTAQMIKEMIKAKESLGWTFVYLGANQDAWQVGRQFGMSAGSLRSFDISNVKGMMTNMVRATNNYATSYTSTSDPSLHQRMSENFFSTAGVDIDGGGIGSSSNVDVNSTASALLGPNIQSLGGLTSAGNMTQEERSARAKKAADVRWKGTRKNKLMKP